MEGLALWSFSFYFSFPNTTNEDKQMCSQNLTQQMTGFSVSLSE